MMLIIIDVGDCKDLLNERVTEGVASNPHDFIGKCHHSSCCTHNILMSLLWLWRKQKDNPAEKSLWFIWPFLEFVYLLNSPWSPHMKYMFPREKLTMTTSFPCFDECHWVRTPSKLMYATIGKTSATSVLPKFSGYWRKTSLTKRPCITLSLACIRFSVTPLKLMYATLINNNKP